MIARLLIIYVLVIHVIGETILLHNSIIDMLLRDLPEWENVMRNV